MADEVYTRLADIVGHQWVSSDPAVVKAYSRELTTYGRFGKDRAPQWVVLPKSTHEIRNILAFANMKRIPVLAYGTAINIGSDAIPKMGGITVDTRRMDQIISIDKDQCTATIQAGVSLARLSSEMQKAGMFIAIPGGPATASVVSNYSQGEFNKASGRLGYQCQTIISTTNVFADGSVVKTGNQADIMSATPIWAQGPGPDLSMILRSTRGSLGIVTEMTIKGVPLDEKAVPMWVSFEDLGAGVAAYKEIVHQEICTGSGFYIGNKYHYFGDTIECGERLCKIHPNMQLILSFQGTPRRVEYEENTVREIMGRYGGQVITDTLPFYQMYSDSHISMGMSLYSEFTMRYFGSPGSGVVFFPNSSLDMLIPAYEAFVKVLLKDPYFRNPEAGDSTLYTGLIGYPSRQGGHYYELEPCTGGWGCDPQFGAAVGRAIPGITKVWADLGLVRDAKTANIRPNEIGLMPAYEAMMKKIKDNFDPNNIMHPGHFTPGLYR